MGDHKHVPMELPATGNPNLFSVNKGVGEFIQVAPPPFFCMNDPKVVGMVRICAECHLLYFEPKQEA